MQQMGRDQYLVVCVGTFVSIDKVHSRLDINICTFCIFNLTFSELHTFVDNSRKRPKERKKLTNNRASSCWCSRCTLTFSFKRYPLWNSSAKVNKIDRDDLCMKIQNCSKNSVQCRRLVTTATKLKKIFLF